MNKCELLNLTIQRLCNSAAPLLPPEYQQVEYIQTATSSTTITTGVTSISNNTSFEIEYMLLSTAGDVVLGCRSTANAGIYLGTWSNGYFQFGDGSHGDTISSIPTQTKVKQKTNKNIIYRYDYSAGEYVLDKTITQSTFTASRNMTVFSQLTASNTYTGYKQGRLYSLKVWEGDALVCSLVPCYRISDNVAGVFNLVTQSFITAATGSFTPGNNV